MLQRVVGASVAVALLAVVSLAVVTTWHSATTAPGPGGAPLTIDGEPLTSAPGTGTYARWHDQQVILVRLPTTSLSPPTLAIAASAGGESLVAYSAKSTHLGCLVEWQPDVRGGILMDVCHQGMWDARALARPVAGTAAPEPLPAYVLTWRNGTLWAEAL